MKSFRYSVMVIMVVALFGCGGGGSSGGDGTTPSTPSDPSVPHSVSGNIGEAISGVTVTLTATGVSQTTTTDNDGEYTFTDLVDGTYTITPSSDDYTFDPVSFHVTINGNNFREQSFLLLYSSGEHDYTVGTMPRALDYDSDGNMWIVNDVSVTKISPLGVTLGTYVLGTSPLSLTSIVVDRSSNTIYITGGTKVFKLNSSGTLVNTFNGFNQAADIVMDYLGNIFVSNSTTDTVAKINSSGTILATYNVGDSPDSLAVDASNNVYVCNYQGASVSKISSTGVVSTLDPNCNYPRDIAVDSNGNLFVTSNADGVVAIMDNTGLLLNTYAITGANYIDFDEDDNLFVACHNTVNGFNSVEKFDTSGTLLHTYSFSSGTNCVMKVRIDLQSNMWICNASIANTVTETVF